MRSQHEIRADIEKARVAWAQARETLPEAQAAPFSRKVKDLQQELSDALTPGAEPCETCGAKPLGLRHVHARMSGKKDADGKPLFYFFHRYEVGCVACGDKRAIAATPEEINGADLDQHADDAIRRAVAKWNEENYLPPTQAQ